MEQWLEFIRDIGFPIVVTFYLLHRIEGKLDEMVQGLQSLAQEISEK